MKFFSIVLKAAVVFSLVFVSCKPAEVTQNTPETVMKDGLQQEVIRLIVNMPAEDKQEEVWVNEQLVNIGADAVHLLAGMLIDPAVGSDLQARYALSSLANYVARPGAASEMDTFESAMLSEIEADYSPDVKSFLMEQLRLSASDRSVPILKEFLTDDFLYNDALRVLLIIDSPSAANSIREKVIGSEGEQQIAMIKALGELEDQGSVEMFQNYADSEHWPLVRISLYALSNIGQPGSSVLFEQAIDDSQGFRRSELISFYLNYAQALLQSGHTAVSEDIADYFLNGDYPSHIKSSALQVLFDVKGDELTGELVTIAQDSDATLANSALRLLNNTEGEDVTEKLMNGFNSSTQTNAIYFIEALGERGDESVVSYLSEQLESSRSDIRLAALKALYQLRGEVDPEHVFEILNSAESDREIQQIEDLMAQLEPNIAIPAAANALADVSNKTKSSLIDLLRTYHAMDVKDTVLSQWNSDAEEVRIAVSEYLGVLGDAGQDADLLIERLGEGRSDNEKQSVRRAFASIMNRSLDADERNQNFYDYYSDGSTGQKEQLLYAAPLINGIDPSRIVESGLGHSSDQVRSASVMVMGEWNHTDLLPLFIFAIGTNDSENKQSLITNFAEIINESEKSLDEKEQMIHELFSAIEPVDHKIELLQKIAESDPLLAVQSTARYLNHESEEIRDASVQIFANLLEPHYSNESKELNVPNGILAVLNSQIREEVRNEIHQRANDQSGYSDDSEMEDEPKYGDLFNGDNLDGWQVIGNEESWGVEDGVLYTDGAGSGWISTDHQYDNFLIELEYRVPEGGNSGLFIRAPHEGNPAVQGLEIQILDDYAEQYADLKPWQFAGSIYFEQAVSKRVTRPAGEWQTMKVRAVGPKIQVILNGEQVIHADLIEYMENAPNHPGLLRRSGYIGLQNHGDRVDFRNIIISEID